MPFSRDTHQTVRDLEARGVEIAAPIDEGWGLLTAIAVPGAGTLGLYEARHASPIRPVADA